MFGSTFTKVEKKGGGVGKKRIFSYSKKSIVKKKIEKGEKG